MNLIRIALGALAALGLAFSTASAQTEDIPASYCTQHRMQALLIRMHKNDNSKIAELLALLKKVESGQGLDRLTDAEQRLLKQIELKVDILDCGSKSCKKPRRLINRDGCAVVGDELAGLLKVVDALRSASSDEEVDFEPIHWNPSHLDTDLRIFVRLNHLFVEGRPKLDLIHEALGKVSSGRGQDVTKGERRLLREIELQVNQAGQMVDREGQVVLGERLTDMSILVAELRNADADLGSVVAESVNDDVKVLIWDLQTAEWNRCGDR